MMIADAGAVLTALMRLDTNVLVDLAGVWLPVVA
ncbi:hypothetical protein predicted by Glimmer/Critica [Lactiplantibacillus plantarum]|nr:hypothetical protein predicted by Glimmer/Critica [Lactiplantibacillus plantarum]